MTRHQFTKNIHKELRTLNERIDYKILRGQAYSQESKRHKELLRYATRQSKGGLLTRLFASFA